MWSRWWNYKWQLAIWMRYSNNWLCVIRFLIILEQSLICVHAYPVTTVVYTGVCMIPVHILHLSLTEICDIHIHYKCLSSVLRVSVPCWFMFDPLQLPQVSHCDIWDGFRFCWVGFISLKNVFLILVIFYHGFIIGPFLGMFKFSLSADFSGLPQMLSVFSEDLSCRRFYDIWSRCSSWYYLCRFPSVFVTHHYLIFYC